MGVKNLGSDFMSIKDFSNFVGITAASLRHYDNEDIFSPAKRGTENKNKYRYYSPMQITTVKMIRVLTDMGVPLGTIKELGQNRTPEKLLRLLNENRNRLEKEMCALQEKHAVISTFTELLNESMMARETELTVTQMPEKRILLGDINDFRGQTSFMREFLRFCNSPHEPEINTSLPIGGYFESMKAFLREPSRPTRFFSVDPKGNGKKAAGLYITGYTRGYYGQTNGLPEQIAAYAARNGFAFDGPVYNIYLSDEISEIDPEHYLLQVSASVAAPRRVPLPPPSVPSAEPQISRST